jgi:hypothetical protein
MLMDLWKWMPAALLSTNLAWAGDCTLPVEATDRVVWPIESQRLVVSGEENFQFSLGEGAQTFAHLSDMLLVKYADGAMLSHRLLAESELRSQTPNQIALADFTRLVFMDSVEAATDQDRQEAEAHRAAIQVGCTAVQRYRIGNSDVYGYAQDRAGGEHYQAWFLLTGDSVHFVDVTGSEALATTVISTLKQRN